MVESDGYEVVFYVRPSGRCPMREFLSELPVKAHAKLTRWLGKLEVMGPELPRPYADIVRGKIRELRMVFASQQIRCLYFFDGKSVIVTHAFIKKADAVPESELNRAESLMGEYFNGKA